MNARQERLNDKIAEMCGWTWDEHELFIKKGDQVSRRAPDYFNDRNCLPELWLAIQERGLWAMFVRSLIGYRPLSYSRCYQAITAEPREHVLAALIVFNVPIESFIDDNTPNS